MKRVILTLSLALSSVFSEKISFGIDLKINTPLDSLSEICDWGIGIGGNFETRINKFFGINFSISYNTYISETEVDSFINWEIKRIYYYNNTVIDIQSKIYLPLQDTDILPFILAGLGGYIQNFEEKTKLNNNLTSKEESSETDLGLKIGIGVFITKNLSLCAIYNHIFWDKNSGKILGFNFRYSFYIK